MMRLVFTCVLLSVLLAPHRSSAQVAKSSPKTNALGITLVRISPGQYQRGARDSKLIESMHPNTVYQGADLRNERPGHPVKISRAFEIATTEITVGQFRTFVKATGYKTDAEKTGGGFAFNPKAKSALNRFQRNPKSTWQLPGFPQSEKHPEIGRAHV